MDVLVRQSDGSYRFANLDAAISNVKTVPYTIGAPGVADCDYNFTSVGNAIEQGIQLGGTTILPANSAINTVIVKCVDGLNGAITGAVHIGTASAGTQYLSSATGCDDTNEMVINAACLVISPSATSVYFSVAPSANWNTVTTGKWKIWITYIDNTNI